jgi:DOPA 4,5-dioxygenase
MFQRVINEGDSIVSRSYNNISEDEVKEWHFHVYWLARNAVSTASAHEFHRKLIEKIESDPAFSVVCHGVSKERYPSLLKKPPQMNMGPVGPHLSGSFECWIPYESLATALSWFILNRGELSILVHPLTRYEIRDHTERSIWIGQPWPLDLSVLSHDLGKAPTQYPELKLGYSA